MQSLPMFTLGAVLFPGGRMPLQIFEQRYLGLVRQCLKQDEAFGVAWITHGSEILQPGKPAPELAAVGTTARIIDWDALPGGLLGVTVEGGDRFRLHSSLQSDDKLMVGEVELLPTPLPEPLPESGESLLEVLVNLERHPHVQRLGIKPDHENAWAVCWTLAQLLPVEEAIKYQILACDTLAGSIDLLDNALNALGADSG
jgi:Lon protease-like protein